MNGLAFERQYAAADSARAAGPLCGHVAGVAAEGSAAVSEGGAAAADSPASYGDAGCVAADSAARSGSCFAGMYPGPDTLGARAWEVPAEAGPDSLAALFREVPVREFFGDRAAVAAVPQAAGCDRDPAVDDPLFQGVVLLAAALYALVIHRHAEEVRGLLVRLRQGFRSDSSQGEAGAHAAFLQGCSLVGLLCVCVAVFRFAACDMPFGAVRALPLTALLAAALVLWQRAALLLAGAVTMARPFAGQLLRLRRQFLALGAVTLTPLLLLCALVPRADARLWLVLGASGAAAVVLLYLKESAGLFLAKKVSILHWFLYLCTVEIFPLSLIWLLAARA